MVTSHFEMLCSFARCQFRIEGLQRRTREFPEKWSRAGIASLVLLF